MQTSLPVSGEIVGVRSLRRTLAGRVAMMLAATVFVAICAQVSVPLWFTPVPLSMQNFAVLLVGLALGPVDGFAAMLLYLAEGASGIPVFSPQGPLGILHLLGPTAGFLWAYPVLAAVMGYVSRLRSFAGRNFAGALVAGVIGTSFLMSVGAGWLAHILHLNAAQAMRMGVVPYLPGEIVKIFAAAGIYSTGKRLFGHEAHCAH